MADLSTRVSDLTVRLGTEFKAVRAELLAKTGDLTTLNTTAKNTLVASLNELKAAIDSVSASVGATIDDTSNASATKTWSINKISASITAAVDGLVSGAPGALDTLDELAAALGDDSNFATTVTTALANRLRIDVNTQGLTDTQKQNGCKNLGIGNPDTNFVTTFEGALI